MLLRLASLCSISTLFLLAGCSADVGDLFQQGGGSGQGASGQGGSGQGAAGQGGAGPSTSVATSSGSTSTTSTTSTTSVSTGPQTSSVSTGGPVCGNGQQENNEECDGLDLGGASCTDLGFQNPSGASCTASCTLSFAGCQPVCGNGSLEPGEACDDGNLIDGDGCSSSCVIAGDTCLSAINTTVGLGQTVLSGSTLGGSNLHAPPTSNGCPDGSGPERIYAVTPLQNGFLTAWLPAASANFDSVLYARASCTNAAAQILCDDNFGTPGDNGGELISFPVLANQTLYLFVDGYGGEAGNYDLTLDLSVGEDCSDPVPIRIEGQGNVTALGSTSGFVSNVTCTSGAGAGPDVVYAVTVTDADNYSFSVDAQYNSVLNARSSCTEFLSQLGCSSPAGNNSSINNLSVDALSTVFLFVDGTAGQSGAYSLTTSH